MSVFDDILKQKREEVALLKEENNPETLREMALENLPCRDFLTSLKDCPHVPIIAEIKKFSPSSGTLQQEVDIGLQAKFYEKGGAAAISVLTDGPYFGGNILDLDDVRNIVSIPVLRKDFILDKIQISQARNAGADAVLLIAAALDYKTLYELYNEIIALGMTPLVEVHNKSELKNVLKLEPKIIGINNRNLKTLAVDLETSVKLRSGIPSDIFVIGESGIDKSEDIIKLYDAGINAFLIGTALMRSDDPSSKLKSLCMSIKNKNS